MKSINKIFFLIIAASLLVISCDDEFGPKKESTPIIESASIETTTFTFGDSIFLIAKIRDHATRLTELNYEIVSEGEIITSGMIPLNGDIFEVEELIYVPLIKNQQDNASLTVNLLAKNVLKGTATHQITGITGKRPNYEVLYLVTDDGNVAELSKESQDMFSSHSLTLDTSFRYKIAEKINSDKTIDYSGDVYGNHNGQIAMIDENGESAFIYADKADYTRDLSFNNMLFEVKIQGNTLGEDDFALSSFSDIDVAGETFRATTRTLEKGKEYSLFGRLADASNIYNPDFFERTADDKVKFTGETREYTIYYNAVRKNIIVALDNPSYPDFLLACGWGLGYPTNITSAEIAAVYSGKKRTHTDWGFDNILKYVLMPRIAEGVYQGTFYTPGDDDHYASFKPFENTGWGNEKKAGQFTFTGVSIISGDDNWEIPNSENDPVIESANYRFTIDLNNNTVNIEKVNL